MGGRIMGELIIEVKSKKCVSFINKLWDTLTEGYLEPLHFTHETKIDTKDYCFHYLSILSWFVKIHEVENCIKIKNEEVIKSAINEKNRVTTRKYCSVCKNIANEFFLEYPIKYSTIFELDAIKQFIDSISLQYDKVFYEKLLKKIEEREALCLSEMNKIEVKEQVEQPIEISKVEKEQPTEIPEGETEKPTETLKVEKEQPVEIPFEPPVEKPEGETEEKQSAESKKSKTEDIQRDTPQRRKLKRKEYK